MKAAIVVAIAALLTHAQNREKRVVPFDAAARQTFERQPKVAVLAGIGTYPVRSGLTQLRYPAHDVDLMRTELTRQGYKVVALKDQEATRGSIRQALRDAAELVDRGSGTVLFFFSGHGFAENGVNYLATFEATSGELESSGLSIPAVEQLLKATGAPRQVVFVDACRNEAGKAAGARSFDRFAASAGLRSLFSTRAGRISYEDDSLGSGVFTHFLVKGLQGDAAGVDGLVTFRDVSDYVTEAVSGFGFQRGQMQVPYEAGESSGDFLLARAAVGGAPPTPVPQETVAGTTKVNDKDGLTYVWIPPGAFSMGCSPGDTECEDDEKPSHQVVISKGFWIGQTEVTQEAYQRVMRTNPSHFKSAKLPVGGISWNEAQSFCQTAGMRLPTEGEWEYAARAGTARARYGDLDSIAWHSKNSGPNVREVGQKQANAWGLHDMLGNVWEWVADWYSDKYRGMGGTEPPSPLQSRVLRGGSWNTHPSYASVSYRYKNAPWQRENDIGIRCAGN